MSKLLTLGSFFDGIGGWLLAAKHAGVKPVWASEIDDFPATVSAHHFPQVKQLGDITKINVDELEPTDIICAGSPCQDLSVAGKREGLAGERSGLFVDAIKLVHGLRERTGKPRYFVWENVPGAFSSNKGLDFRAVLEEISQTIIPMPKDNKWAEAGVVEWNGGSLAWRVLDAQYWGVPQRRKRIFLVADFGGRSAGEILFERQSLSGDSAESEGKREGVAGDAGASTDSASGSKYRQGAKAGGIGYQNGKAPTLDLSQNCAVYDISHRQDVIRPQENGTLPCLTARAGTGGNNLPVVHSYCIAGNTIDRKPQNGGNGNGNQEELSYTLNTVNRHAVVECFPQNAYDKFLQGTPLTTLKASGGSYGGGSESLIAENPTGKVRRLTTTECERLQGLPDGYTDIEFNGKPAPDSRRYKAIGNGMAQPCADFVIRRIAEVVSNEDIDLYRQRITSTLQGQ